MIRKIELPERFSVPEDTPFGCRVRAAEEAYGLSEPFAQFWEQEGGSVLGKLDDALVFEDVRPDYSEWKEFIRILGAKTLLCSEETAEKLGLSPSSRGEILFRESREAEAPPPEAVLNPGVREIYALLSACRTESFVPPEFEPFYMDLSHRIRHGAGLSAGVKGSDGALAACAVCAAKTDCSAVVSAVAVAPGERHRGLGRTVVDALASQLPQRRIYIFRRDGENEEFYRALGFEPCGRWAEVVFG